MKIDYNIETTNHTFLRVPLENNIGIEVIVDFSEPNYPISIERVDGYSDSICLSTDQAACLVRTIKWVLETIDKAEETIKENVSCYESNLISEVKEILDGY